MGSEMCIRDREWVADHPGIKTFRRIVKFSNPGRSLDSDKADMRALGATVKEVEYRALGGRDLKLTDNPAFAELLDGMDRGDVDVSMKAVQGNLESTYTSKDRPDNTFIDAFDTLEDGMEGVLSALRIYSSQQSAKLRSA